MKTGKIVRLACAATLIASGMASCVSMKTYRQTQQRALRCEYNSEALLSEMEQLREQRAALEAQFDAEGMTNDELRALLQERTRALDEVRDLLGEALRDFDSEGLSVSERGGMIYVSMDEKLLFELGKAEVSPEGERAVQRVAEVLARNPNIRITIEGHTDNLPYRSKPEDQILDNWDLSVHAAGRSQYVPVASGNSSEARARNRRTEIILTPDMDRLMELLDQAGQITNNTR